MCYLYVHADFVFELSVGKSMVNGQFIVVCALILCNLTQFIQHIMKTILSTWCISRLAMCRSLCRNESHHPNNPHPNTKMNPHPTHCLIPDVYPEWLCVDALCRHEQSPPPPTHKHTKSAHTTPPLPQLPTPTNTHTHTHCVIPDVYPDWLYVDALYRLPRSVTFLYSRSDWRNPSWRREWWRSVYLVRCTALDILGTLRARSRPN